MDMGLRCVFDLFHVVAQYLRYSIAPIGAIEKFC